MFNWLLFAQIGSAFDRILIVYH